MVKETVANTTIKKQRKKSTSTPDLSKLDEDAYKKIVNFEETEAYKRSAEKDAELFFETCENIRQLLTEIAALKKLGTTEAKATICDKRVEACMLVAVLKKLNRLEKFRTKTGRDALHQEKLQTDSTKLQLQNLLYELTYLKKEIAKCFQFKSLDEEVDLISKEEFFKSAPESISKPDATKTDQHKLQLARLEWELQQRKELASQCRKLETEKENVGSQIVSKQERLEKLAPQLKNILDATKPLQEQFGMVADKVREEHHLAYLLPNPLYLLYAKVGAYSQVYDKNAKVHILGQEEEARQLKKDDIDEDSTGDSDSDQDVSEDLPDRQKRHHRKSSRVIEPMDAKRDKLLASHPLFVRVEITLDGGKAPNLILDFYYKTKLHVVTVKCVVNTPEPITGISTGEVLSPVNMLRELFPNENGEESPNPTNHYQLQQLQLGNFSSLLDQLGYPYAWAQRICGLEFIGSKPGCRPPTASAELSQSSVESVMKVLSRRFRSRISLAKQIQELEKNIIPVVSDNYHVPLKLNGAITQWQRITWQEYSECPSTDKLIAEQFVTNADMLYRVVITRNSAKLLALIAIKNSFPEDKSIFTISVHWNETYHSNNCDAIRDMERAVNSDWPTDTNRNINIWLLSAQIRRLVACFDIYLEVTSPDEFTREKIYFSSTRGRNRNKPYKYLKMGGGVFTQY
ncbi:thoc5 [Carabus blaptoides fortunei]